ncbi:MAG: glycosyltransferase family 2 protein, partial [Candidatus Helarchaeota archaeon]
MFDESYYKQTYSEIQSVRINPIMHYIKTGWSEGKNPSPDFDTVYYLRENKDIRKAQINPLVHFIQYGQGEGRPPNRSLSKDPYTYYAWIDQFDTLTSNDKELIETQIEAFKCKPLISILMPVYNTPEQFLREALDSLLVQYYTNWECCIADDASSNPNINKILDSYTKKDSRFRVVYRETSMASGEYIGLLDHDDVLRAHALYLVVNEINKFPDSQIIYSDEDLIDEFSVRYDPYFKPDWNPDLFYGHNLITHFGVYKADRIRQVNGFREGYEGAQDWDLA